MAEIGWKKWRTVGVISIVVASMLASASGTKEDMVAEAAVDMDMDMDGGYFVKLANYLFQTNGSGYQHVWPEMEFGWKIVIGTFFGFVGAAFGSVGGIGGGGIFVPMLTLIIGFDPKSATSISKCMIMGAAASSVYYNLKLRHPTLDMPIIDYDLALLIQPMLMLGISIGVSFNVIFADWMVTILLITLCIATSTKAFCRGVDTWKKETIIKKEATKRLEHNDEVDYKVLHGGPSNETNAGEPLKQEFTVVENVYWKELGLLVIVWLAFLSLQIAKTYTSTCSIEYWVLNLLQVPVSFGISGYEAVSLYNGSRKISSRVDSDTNLRVGQLILYCSCGVLAGIVGGLLGIGGGSIMGTLFLELGVPPQVSSATSIFAMLFSSSMSAVEYYLLKRFPVPYAFYFVVVATIAAFVGQHFVRKIVTRLPYSSVQLH